MIHCPPDIHNTPDPITIPIGGDGTDEGARAYVTIHGDYISEREFNEAMDRYFEAVSKDVSSEVQDSFMNKKLYISKEITNEC